MTRPHPLQSNDAMHELSLAEEVIHLVETTARREAACRVRLVVLEIGRLSAVEPEALRFCFTAVSQGGIADGARLEIIDVPGSGWCDTCAASVPIVDRHDACPMCGGYALQPNGGNEMRVREIEIE